MNRPSHYLLLCVLLFGGYLAVSGGTGAGEKPAARGIQVQRVTAKDPRPQPQAPLAVVEGFVLDAMGFRMVGAEVAVARGGQTGDEAGERMRTDADGGFRFELPGRGPVACSVQASGFRPLRQTVRPAAGDPVVMALEPQAPWDAPATGPEPTPAPAPGAEFAGEGFVRDANGKAVAGGLVVVRETGACARTDDIGRFRIELPQEGPATLLLHHDGKGPSGLCALAEPMDFDRRRGLVPLPDLVAQPGAAIRGTLRDPQGQPVTGVPLLLTGHGLRRLVLSGPDGAFGIAGLLGGRYQLLALAFRGAVAATAEVRVDAPLVTCELRLEATQNRRLQVLDEAGAPMGGAYVAASFGGQRRAVAQADPQGWLDLPAVASPALPTELEVRTADLRELSLRRQSDHALVVAAP